LTEEVNAVHRDEVYRFVGMGVVEYVVGRALCIRKLVVRAQRPVRKEMDTFGSLLWRVYVDKCDVSLAFEDGHVGSYECELSRLVYGCYSETVGNSSSPDVGVRHA
jgi:hypothetical protein